MKLPAVGTYWNQSTDLTGLVKITNNRDIIKYVVINHNAFKIGYLLSCNNTTFQRMFGYEQVCFKDVFRNEL